MYRILLRSVLGQAAALAGKVLWAFPPPELAGEVLDVITEAFRRQPWGTRATVVVPEWRERTWHKQYVRTPSSVFWQISVLGAGNHLCSWPSGRVGDRSPYDLLVLRLP